MPDDRKKLPYCTAPFTSFVVDPNKGVRPCCTFGSQLGNLNQQSVSEILSNDAWTKVMDQVANDEIPVGCLNCHKREQRTGWSNRQLFIKAPSAINGTWANGITEIEINSTNVCNFSCTHCRPGLSSKWIKLAEQLDAENVSHQRLNVGKVYRPDPKNMLHNIQELDLQNLELIRFKGGEPMLNEDVKAVLKYLRDEDILSRVHVEFVTNGSIIDEEVFQLLEPAKEVDMYLSVDGVGQVQRYIRIGDSGNDKIEAFVKRFSQLQNVSFSPSISVMAYNVFSLDKLADWWNGLHQKYGSKVSYPITFALHVIEPEILSLRVLQDPTRQNLLDKYRSLDNADYTTVIKGLQQSYGGNHLHNLFVDYTKGMDKIRGLTCKEVIPELAEELHYLEELTVSDELLRSISNKDWQAVQQGNDAIDLRNKEDVIQIGTSLSAKGCYHEAALLYQKYLEGKPEEVEVLLHLAIALLNNGDHNMAFEQFSSLINADPYGALEFINNTTLAEDGSFMQVPFNSLKPELPFFQRPGSKPFLAGIALVATNRQAEGKESLRLSISAEPDFKLAQIALAALS